MSEVKLTLGGSDVTPDEGVRFAWGGASHNPGHRGPGFVWMHHLSMREQDFQFFRSWVTNPAGYPMGGVVMKPIPVHEFDADPWKFIQKSSTVGKWDPEYTTDWVEHAPSEELKRRRKRNAGGIGSLVYEMQKLRRAGIKGRMPEPSYRPGGRKYDRGFWYKDAEGNMVRGIPPENSGLTHKEDGVNVVGPKEDKNNVLKEHKIVWNDEEKLWDLVEK